MFTVTPSQLASIATVVKFGATADRITPVIQYGELVADGDTLTVTATDRYVAVVATYKLETPAVEPVTMLVHVDWLTAAASRFKNGISTFDRETATDGAPLVTIKCPFEPGLVMGGVEPGGNFPPVGRLFPDSSVELCDIANDVCLNMATLGRIATIKLPGERGTAHKTAGWRVNGTPESSPGSGRRKMTPLLVSRGDVRILVQPNMLRD